MADKLDREDEREESLSNALEPFLPVARQFVENQAKTVQLQSEVQKMQVENQFQLSNNQETKRFEFATAKLEFKKFQYQRQFLLVIFTTTLIGCVTGVLLYRGETAAALLVVSHAAALAAGWLGGAGYQKTAQNENKPK